MSESPKQSQEQLRAIVHGHVHGVYFRATTQQEAARLGLTGWVRNVEDGTVEVVAEGPRPALETLLAFLHQGPPNARVTAVDAEWDRATHRYDGFTVKSSRFCNG